MNKEKYLELKNSIEESGLTPFSYLKNININPVLFYQARKRYENNSQSIQIRKVEDAQSINEESKTSNEFLHATSEFITINGFKIEGNSNLIKEIIVKLLKETKNV